MRKRVFEILFFIFLLGAMGIIFYQMYLRKNGRENETDQFDDLKFVFMVLAILARLAPFVFKKWFNADSINKK